jgi:hypothetical protein
MRRLSAILTVLLLLVALSVAQAQFDYQIEGGVVAITGYNGPGGAVTIPSTINGMQVWRLQALPLITSPA